MHRRVFCMSEIKKNPQRLLSEDRTIIETRIKHREKLARLAFLLLHHLQGREVIPLLDGKALHLLKQFRSNFMLP